MVYSNINSCNFGQLLTIMIMIYQTDFSLNNHTLCSGFTRKMVPRFHLDGFNVVLGANGMGDKLIFHPNEALFSERQKNAMFTNFIVLFIFI